MANTTLLSSDVNATGTGTSITGACAIAISDLSVHEYVTIQHSASDANYRTLVRRAGPDPAPFYIQNPGTYFLKAILSGVSGTRSAAVAVVAQQ